MTFHSDTGLQRATDGYYIPPYAREFMRVATKEKPIKQQPAPEPTTELSLPERAQVALNSSDTEKRLVELSTEFKSITTITNKDGREECHSALMTLVNARTTVEKTAKAAREDATKFSKAVIAEENRLIAITAAEEKRLSDLRAEWDTKKELERKAAEEAERQRVEAIQNQIRDIKAIPYQFVSASLEEIQGRIELMEAEVPDPEHFGDLLLDAKIAHKDSLHALRTRYTQKQQEIEAAAAAEAERQALEAQRAEQARVAAEQAAAQAAIKEQQDAIDAENARLQKERDELAAKELALQVELDKKLEEIIPDHVAVGPIITATEIIERQKAAGLDFSNKGFSEDIGIPVAQVDSFEEALGELTAGEIVAKVYLPTNIELYTYLHTCTMNHYGLDAKEAKRIIIEMAKAMKI